MRRPADKRALLVLDTCEHLVEAVAVLASRLLGAAPDVYILATSREALQIEGERVYRLGSLASPPDDVVASAEAIRAFPATCLFLERAIAHDTHLDIDDADAPVVAAICRKLDGVALAIELTARRVESYGLRQTAELLDQHVTLSWSGLRTAQPRHRTLQATLDWSYALLSEIERAVLRRLAADFVEKPARSTAHPPISVFPGGVPMRFCPVPRRGVSIHAAFMR
jgi:predicted ATPase